MRPWTNWWQAGLSFSTKACGISKLVQRAAAMRLLNSEGINDFAPVGLLGGHDNSPGSRLLNKGLTHHLVGRWRQAEIYYRSFLQQHPRHPEALHLLAVVLHQRGKSAKAVDLLETAIKVCPNEPRFYLSYGESQRALHQ